MHHGCLQQSALGAIHLSSNHCLRLFATGALTSLNASMLDLLVVAWCNSTCSVDQSAVTVPLLPSQRLEFIPNLHVRPYRHLGERLSTPFSPGQIQANHGS